MTEEYCLHVQQVISAHADGHPVDATELSSAEEHRMSCERCARFAAALELLGAVEPVAVPEVTIALALRAVEEVRTAEASAPSVVEPTPRRASMPQTARPLPRSWLAWGAWGGAAAAVLVVVILVTARGLTYMMGAGVTRDAGDVMMTAPQTGAPTSESGLANGQESKTDDSPSEDAPAGPRYVTYGEGVYLLEAASVEIPAGASILGSTQFDLGSGIAGNRLIYDGGAPDRILVQGDESGGYPATAVTTSRGGVVFSLRAAPLTAIGQWPGLPSRFATPISPDGSPTFEPAETDSAGGTIYVLPGTDATSGFALPPGAAAGEGATNPNWTWWEPL
jgi:hypothetical protein